MPRRNPRASAPPITTTPDYDYAWAQYAQSWLSRFPWCGQRADGHLHAEHSECTQLDRRIYADRVDHIVPLGKDQSRKYDRGNLESLCASCARRKGRPTGSQNVRRVEDVGGSSPGDQGE